MARGTAARRVRALGILLAAAACGSPGPRPLLFGTEQCAHCHMTLADPRFAAQLVTTTGKSIPFDDVGCLAEYVAAGRVSRERIASLWVSDFAEPDSLLEVHRAVFVRSDSLRTPMDHHVVAFRPGRAADSARAALGGLVLTWDQVLAQVAKRPPH